MKRFDLNRHTHRLLQDEPFFTAISRRVSKRPTTTIPTAGVTVDPETGKFMMLYNPEFFESLSDEHRCGILMHEFYHLVFRHVTTRLPEEGMSKLWNIATDLAINSHIADKLPDNALIPGREPYQDYPPGKSSEWYYERLKVGVSLGGDNPQGSAKPGSGKPAGEPEEEGEDGEKGKGEGKGGGKGEAEGEDPETLDDHSGWGQSGDIADVADQRLRELLEDAVKECKSQRSFGSVPSEVSRELVKSIHRTLDPEKVLRYFVKTSRKSNRRSTVRRINKRYPYIHPGKRVNRVANIAISVDQSGSVDDEMLKEFFNLLNKFAKLATFTVVPFDTTVCEGSVYVWEKGQSSNWERVRYGGTNFDAPTDWVNSRNFDGHIVLTDMCAPKPKASKCQRMWITTPHYARNPYFQTNERILAIGS